MNNGKSKTLTKREVTTFFDLLKSQLMHDFDSDAKLELYTLDYFYINLKTEKAEHLEAVARNIITESKYKKFPTLFVVEDVLNTLFPMRKIVREVSVDSIKDNIEKQANEESKEWLKENQVQTPEEIKVLIEKLVEEKTIPKASHLKT